MSERDEPSAKEPTYRCPHCDSVVAADTERCLMCGAVQPERPLSTSYSLTKDELETDSKIDSSSEEVVAQLPEELPDPDPPALSEMPLEKKTEIPAITGESEDEFASTPVFVHVEDPEYAKGKPTTTFKPFGLDKKLPSKLSGAKNLSGLGYGITAVVIIFIILLGIFTIQPSNASAIVGQETVAVLLSPSATLTPEPSPSPTNTDLPPDTPTMTLTPAPTNTLQPPREHTISSGDTLFDLALQYRVSLESILETNEMTQNSSIIAGQPLFIPWPTATPPLEPVGIEYNGELVIADPTDCRRYEIVAGDSLNAIAARADIDYDLFLLVNRLTSESIIQPGDTVCIPEIVYGATLQPTAGPSPTPSLTPLPPGPSLLYPVQDAIIDPPSGLIMLQWVALHDLADNEWYMVEVTDVNALDGAPWRGFTRDSAFQVPPSWRPPTNDMHQMRWRVSLVEVTGFREDGLPIYTFGGQSSQEAFFNWQGAVPTPTPLPTATPMATPEPTTAIDE